MTGCYDTGFPAAIPMAKAKFSYALDTLRSIAADVLARAKSGGASGCETEVSEGYGQTVTVRMGEVETIEYNRDKGIGVTVYAGKQKGYASTSDFSPKAVADTVDAALSIARFTAADESAGLAEPELLAKEIGDLDLFHPWDISVERAIEMARSAEAAAFRLDPRVTNSEGATVSAQESQFISANSNGFTAGYPSSRHYVSVAVIAAQGDEMERDDWYSSARSHRDLASPEAIGDYAGRRALARLRSRKLTTRQAPVLFEAPMANGLLGHFVGAASGGNLYRKASFLVDSLGKPLFSPIVQLREEPHLRRGLASGYFDDDGVATHPRDVVKDGVLQGYFLGVYSARKLGMKTTGNAGGNHNLILAPGTESLVGLLKRMGTGLLVTEVMGQGVNTVTGDYSRGAAGYWVEGGEIAYPVSEITIAGNLRDMYRNIVAVGSDMLVRGSRQCG
ncbi:MAG: modulator of gyrase family protein, partial [Proteobacteria bacterium]|nr:modulator of gyrase family protein [Pseudomonadota bacterium]